MINLEWVKDYIDISDQNLKDLAIKITKAGINVEKVITKNIDNLVIGQITECKMHPDSDHLHICMVNVGNETLQIVCGANNVEKGIKVIVALPGAFLPGDFQIKKGKIRGIESNGMICALFELGLEEKTEDNYNKGIEVLDDNAPIGQNPIEYLKLDDTLYELDIHKHRNNDCYYHIGFAYEISAILNRKVHLPEDNTNPIKDNIKDYFELKVSTDKCPYYLAKMVNDIKIKESPAFIKNRLISAGMRPINNVVDISNYVMLEYGQPMHFFDKDELGNKIEVRNAKENEKILTLDGKERTLKKEDIVITDGNNPVCIAGVMGGQNTEVTEKTTNILIESAIFDPVSIRYTSTSLNLKSEASIRYGKGLNYEYTEKAIERACHLLEKYANAKVLTGTIKHDKVDKNNKQVEFKTKQINDMLGITLTDNEIKKELERLDFEYKQNKDSFLVTIPKRRLDIDPYINDIAEEIGRLYGYHNLISTLPLSQTKKGKYIGDVKYIKLISKRLRALGLNEVKTYTLISPEMAKLFDYEEKIILPNPMSNDKSLLRTSLLSSLLNTYEYNKARKVKNINCYEISKTYNKNIEEDIKISILMEGNYILNNWNQKHIKVDFYLIKGIVENLLDYMGLKNRYTFKQEEISSLHPGIGAKIILDKEEIGIIGKVHPIVNKDDIYVAELSLLKLIKNIKPIKYKPASKYPNIIKDLALVVDKNVSSEDILKEIKKAGTRLLTNVDVFDIYMGEKIESNKKSIAYSLTFSDSTRTLTDEEVNNVFENIIEKVTAKDIHLRK